jgi:hypothetical protein
VKIVATLASTALAAILSGGVIAAVMGILFAKRTEGLKAEVQKSLSVFHSSLAWEEKSLSELLGPVCVHLDRTRRAFNRWSRKNLFLEAKIIREGNITIRDLLLSRYHLVPPQLREDAGHLIEHYDRWLEEYERIRESSKPELDAAFVFVGVGDDPYPFPHDAEQHFKSAFEQGWKRLYRDRDAS